MTAISKYAKTCTSNSTDFDGSFD